MLNRLLTGPTIRTFLWVTHSPLACLPNSSNNPWLPEQNFKRNLEGAPFTYSFDMWKYVWAITASVSDLLVEADCILFFLADINQLLQDPPIHGPCSRYSITDSATGDKFVGKITLTFEGDPFKVSHCWQNNWNTIAGFHLRAWGRVQG